MPTIDDFIRPKEWVSDFLIEMGKVIRRWGEKDFLALVVKGTFKLKGDMGKIMRFARFIRAVANSISSFESEFLGE